MLIGGFSIYSTYSSKVVGGSKRYNKYITLRKNRTSRNADTTATFLDGNHASITLFYTMAWLLRALTLTFWLCPLLLVEAHGSLKAVEVGGKQYLAWQVLLPICQRLVRC
jgi:hypothetical protein